MSLFLLTFFTVYGGMHLYAFLKARAGTGFGLKAGIVIALFMIFMIFTPILVRLLEKAGFEMPARTLSYVGYTWLGILFLFISFAVAIDVYRAGIYVLGIAFKKDLSHVMLTSQLSFFVPLFIAITIAFLGYFEARNIKTENVVIKTTKLPKHIHKLKIVQISDVHVGLIVREKRVQRILNAVKKENPDVLVSTGDLVDGQIDNLEGIADLLQTVKPRYGKYAITGNHEYYAGLRQALRFTQKAGFTLLRGEATSIEGIINIAGVDDPAGKSFDHPASKSEREILEGLPDDRFTVLLKHRPAIDRDSIGLFDLQLSGHTHKGQIFPFNIVTWYYYPIHSGCLTPVDGCHLYVSRGSGTWGPPIRFLSPPEVTLIELVREE